MTRRQPAERRQPRRRSVWSSAQASQNLGQLVLRPAAAFAMAMPRRPRSLIELAVLSLAIALCAVPAHAQGGVLPLPPDDRQVIAAKLGPAVVGAARPSETILDASAYFPLQPKTFPFQVTAGKNAGNTHAPRLQAAPRPGRLPACRL